MSFEVVQVRDSRDLFFGLIFGLDANGYMSVPHDERLPRAFASIYYDHSKTVPSLRICDRSHFIDGHHIQWLLDESRMNGLIRSSSTKGWIHLKTPLINYAPQEIHPNGNLPFFRDLASIFVSDMERDIYK